MSEDYQKLEIPYVCVIPSAVRLNKKIPDAAKIYLGELVVLAGKFGYCYASDEQLAEMKEVSIATIERWHLLLEREGFIWRDTKNIPQKIDGKLHWKRKRKIYLDQSFSRKKCGPLKNEGTNDPLKNEGTNDPLKNEGRNNKPLKVEPLNNKQDVVVVPLEIRKIFEEFSLKEDKLLEFSKIPMEELRNRILAFEQYRAKRYVDNHTGCLITAIEEAWKPSEKISKEQQQQTEQEQRVDKVESNRAIAIQLEAKYCQKFTRHTNFEVKSNIIYMKLDSKIYPADLSDDKCIDLLKDFIQKNFSKP
jgi:hypothetical protein